MDNRFTGFKHYVSVFPMTICISIFGFFFILPFILMGLWFVLLIYLGTVLLTNAFCYRALLNLDKEYGSWSGPTKEQITTRNRMMLEYWPYTDTKRFVGGHDLLKERCGLA